MTKYLIFYRVTGRSTETSIDMSGSKLLNILHFTIVLVDLWKFHGHVWIKIKEYLTFYHSTGRSTEISIYRHVWIKITEYLTFYHSTGRSTEISIDMSGSKLLNILYFTMVLVDLQKFQ